MAGYAGAQYFLSKYDYLARVPQEADKLFRSKATLDAITLVIPWSFSVNPARCNAREARSCVGCRMRVGNDQPFFISACRRDSRYGHQSLGNSICQRHL